MSTELAKDKIIRVSFRLVGEKGFPATTVDEICTAAKVSKGSFYHFFKSKEELGLVMLENFWDRSQTVLGGGDYHQETDPNQRLRKFFDYIEQSSSYLWSDGCLLGNFSMELAETSPIIRKRVSEIFTEFTDLLTPLFASANLACRNEIAPDDLVRQFLAVIEGSILFAKAHKDIRFIPEGIRNFRKLLLPDTAKRVAGRTTKGRSAVIRRKIETSVISTN